MLLQSHRKIKFTVSLVNGASRKIVSFCWIFVNFHFVIVGTANFEPFRNEKIMQPKLERKIMTTGPDDELFKKFHAKKDPKILAPKSPKFEGLSTQNCDRVLK